MWPEQPEWIPILTILYILLVIGVCLRIIYDTRSVNKTLAYLLTTVFLPFIGIAFYFSFGVNYRKRKIYNKKLVIDGSIKQDFQNMVQLVNDKLAEAGNQISKQDRELMSLLSNNKTGYHPALTNSEIRILSNGEEFFPRLIEELQKAKEHIHIQFYIYEDDVIGNQIKDLLIQKAKQGVEVRFIYDDFGSRDIRKNVVKELQDAGIEAFPFNKIRWIAFANRLNYRNHRKMVIIDGITSFTGGINISDRYINTPASKSFWRDTQIMIKGHSTLSLQRIFLSDWNYCSNRNMVLNRKYFPLVVVPEQDSVLVQVISSGPDSDLPGILYSVLKSVNLAEKEILLTTPYYIPDNSLQESLIIAALSGIDVKLLVPKHGDSKLVNMASQAYFEDLLQAGVKIYLYKKGFIHAKTFVIDRNMASVGTANLDLRSFDLNFEVSAIIYADKIALQLAEKFEEDLADSDELTLKNWGKRSGFRKMSERIIRLLSPFM